jgi:predicted nucleic acid-binding protein
VRVQDTELTASLLEKLDKGESEAITLYKESSADILLIDERRGRKLAKEMNVNIIGSLGILLKAKVEGLIDRIKPSIEILRHSNIRITEDLYAFILQQSGE